MGNKPAKQEEREETLVLRVPPPLDPAFIKWLARDVNRLHQFAPKNPRPIEPPDRYIEYMRFNGWLDLDMDDPDLQFLLN